MATPINRTIVDDSEVPSETLECPKCGAGIASITWVYRQLVERRVQVAPLQDGSIDYSRVMHLFDGDPEPICGWFECACGTTFGRENYAGYETLKEDADMSERASG